MDRPKRTVGKPNRYKTTSSEEEPPRKFKKQSHSTAGNIEDDILDIRAVLEDCNDNEITEKERHAERKRHSDPQTFVNQTNNQSSQQNHSYVHPLTHSSMQPHSSTPYQPFTQLQTQHRIPNNQTSEQNKSYEHSITHSSTQLQSSMQLQTLTQRIIPNNQTLKQYHSKKHFEPYQHFPNPQTLQQSVSQPSTYSNIHIERACSSSQPSSSSHKNQSYVNSSLFNHSTELQTRPSTTYTLTELQPFTQLEKAANSTICTNIQESAQEKQNVDLNQNQIHIPVSEQEKENENVDQNQIHIEREKVLNQDVLLQELKQMNGMLKTIINYVKPSYRRQTKPDILPIKTVGEMNAFQGADEEEYLEVVQYFINIGGYNVKEAINTCLKESFVDSLAPSFTWWGREEGQLPFYNNRLVLAIYDAVCQNKMFKQPTRSEFQKIMREALRAAKERDRFKRVGRRDKGRKPQIQKNFWEDEDDEDEEQGLQNILHNNI